MEAALGISTLAAAVIAVTAVAGRLRLPAPLVLMVVGIAASFIPWIPEIHLTPELVLLGLLPPLLYATAIRSSVVDFRAQAATIGLLSVGMVVVTALGVGLLVWLLLPIPFAAAFAFGAVIAPPDAVAATSVARRVGLPRRLVTLLEGESLFNDATAITCLRVGILTLGAGVSVAEVGLAFLVAAGGGVLIGLLVAWLAGLLRRRITSPALDNAISLLLPFVAYLPAEELGVGHFHASGVIAVVTAGLIIGHKAPVVQTAQSRLSERMNWTTIQFVLENAVFLLIGLQARWILADLIATDLAVGTVIAVCAAALGGAILIRMAMVWVFRLTLLRRDGGQSRAGAAETMIIGWAGMRGVVTLAAAFVLPESIRYRPVLVFAAMVVTAGSLLLQGLTLPALARRTGLRGPDAREDALQAASVLQKSSRAALSRLDEITEDTDSAETLLQLRERISQRTNAIWERLGASSDVETPAEEYRRLRLATLQTERETVLRIRAHGKIDHEVIDDVLYSLDVEESMLTVLAEQSDDVAVDEPLTAPDRIAAGCEHLAEAPSVIKPDGPGYCLDCEREGTRTVHLRLCLTCGNVGCCDSSPAQHSRRHWKQTGHVVMRSFEQGESWRWCFVDERLG
ncbi:Na+/H+ antiporter [Microlunatus soli]|uniref:Sodium/proton antiporter, CPA1 family n=1 Tax=Microlunatus soli TaxID=630515 RepID=A0A1H1X1L1_9ACTN|nr:Na+/H+ antiporter [Microlunatus soli]SDT03188.1 sodium/proton antiporter, CPA1 family [Microlunatus soli]